MIPSPNHGYWWRSFPKYFYTSRDMSSFHNSAMDKTAQLPPGGASSKLSTISQSFSFHASPESFISSRRATEDPDLSHPLPAVVRARIINRDVAVITSHQFCQDILHHGHGDDSESTVSTADGMAPTKPLFLVQPAYRELMTDFFPPPNILLSDPPDHGPKRELWNEHMASFSASSSSTIRQIVSDEVATWENGSTINLYKAMKSLSWRILLGIVLQLEPNHEAYSSIVSLQENVLRGQFSLFPVSINAPFWRSPRAKGIEARRKLEPMLKANVDSQASGCPFRQRSEINGSELAADALLFTSSIAVKALASLLTATLLNLYESSSEESLASRVQNLDRSDRDNLISSILLETERLSPPVVGVMRRVQQDVVLTDSDHQQQQQSPILIPAGWDVWCYFAGASRDGCIYERPTKFIPERFNLPNGAKPGFAFGFGDKTCLGRDLSRQIVHTVASTVLDVGVRLEGSVEEAGVRGWLGWDENVPVELMARDMKQLPCQRPRNPIRLRVTRP